MASSTAGAEGAGAETGSHVRRAAVLGHPVGHSLSPALHRAGYAVLGLAGHTYDAIDCPAGALAGIVDAAGPEWVGFSVTMPGKPEALARADVVTERARVVDSANTLVRTEAGWRADCTDIDGAAAALDRFADLPVQAHVVVLGVGGTARPVLAALAARAADAGCPPGEVTLASRRPTGGPALECAERLGLPARWRALATNSADGIDAELRAADLVVSTVPADGAAELAPRLRGVRRLFDALYAPWPSPAAAAVLDGGGEVVGGDVMLLAQALGQFEQFTGHPAPRAAMAGALDSALGR